jgi:hypothetical protein
MWRLLLYILNNFLQQKWKPPGKKQEEGQNPPVLIKPEEQEGMPQHQYCTRAKHRDDKSPKYYEEHQKDVAGILAPHPSQKTDERG